MNHEAQELIEKAHKIISRTGTKPGTRYPKSLKNIVISLRLDHDMSVRDITREVGVSTYSAREWPKASQKKVQFNKVLVSNKAEKEVQIKSEFQNHSYYLKSIELSLKVLIVLTTLLIFEPILIHLIF